MSRKEPKRVFVSYSWDDVDYKLWVRGLATRLRQDGVDARLDHWHLRPGQTIPEFMNSEVRNADMVLTLCTPEYRNKVHAVEDGVKMAGSGWEAMLVTSELFGGASRSKMLPALARGAWSEAAPSWMASLDYVDLSSADTFEENYTALLRRITGTAEAAPPLGELPTGLDVAPVEPLYGRPFREDAENEHASAVQEPVMSASRQVKNSRTSSTRMSQIRVHRHDRPKVVRVREARPQGPAPCNLLSSKGIDLRAVPLVDRHGELNWLRTKARRVQETASGRLVSIVGPRGVGKSRVVATFADWCRDQKMIVLQAQCVGRTAEPLLPVGDALRQALGTTPEEIGQALRWSTPDLLDAVPVIGRFLRGQAPELSTGPQMGGDNPRGLYDILASVMVRLGSNSGMVLLVEDVHLADLDTLSFLTYLMNKSRGCPALTLVTLPSEEQEKPASAGYLKQCLHEWAEKGAEPLTIEPFGWTEVAQYLEAVMGEGAFDESEVNRMLDFTGGNPLLLGETVTVDGDGFTGGLQEVPDRIRALLQHRLRQLDDDLRSFLGAAAVVGETSHELVPILRVLGVDDALGFRTLRRACTSNSLCEGDDGHGHVLFTSELLRMVTYEEIGTNLRCSLHLRAGEWFEQQHNYSAAAHHFACAENWRKMVPAAFRAAEAAEYVGLYRAAVDWYRRIKLHAEPDDLNDLYPRLAKALLVVGEWGNAEEILAELPRTEPRTMMLWSRLCFVRGEITSAAKHATRALGGAETDDIEALAFLANIRLYSGDFAKAAEYADRALLIACNGGSTKDQARCHIVNGACQLYNGDSLAAERSFRDGILLLESSPPAERDKGAYSALLGNRGFVEEIQNRWDDAEKSHGEALRLRREIGDAVGIVESTLAIGRVALGRGAFESAGEHLTAAQRRAEDLDEELQQAKIIHARGELAARMDDVHAAVKFVCDARRRFKECGTLYDVAYTDLSLSRILADSRPWESVERLALARAVVERKGFTLLRRLYPELGPPLADRIEAGLLAYAAGDALGLPWEGRPPGEVRMAELEHLPETDLWRSGSTSDDMALTLLVADHLAGAGGLGEPIRFLETLFVRSPSIPGLGPSTTRAIEHFAATGEPDESGSNTNGAPMRALPVGWAVPASADTKRREWTIGLTRMTHTGREAIAAACVMSACAAWAIEGAKPPLLAEIANLEAAVVGPETNVARSVAAVHDNSWAPPMNGITLDPAETVAAVLYSCRSSDGLVATLRRAVSLGGDTDTVAALVGGLLGSQLSPAAVREQVTWLDRVDLPAGNRLAALATSLAEIRLTANG